MGRLFRPLQASLPGLVAVMPGRHDAEILRLRAEGRTFSEMAQELGISRGTVSGTMARLAGKRQIDPGIRRFTVRAYLFRSLEREAKARGMYPSALIDRILCRVINDDLINAVLDE